jgi:hypothetical protein
MIDQQITDFVQSQIDRHQAVCQRGIDGRISDLVTATHSLLEISSNLMANVAKLDERTTLHGQQIDRVEAAQAAGNRYAIATVVGLAVTLLTVIFSMIVKYL